LSLKFLNHFRTTEQEHCSVTAKEDELPSPDCIDKSLSENTKEVVTSSTFSEDHNENTDVTSSAYIDESLNGLDQEDPILIEAIKKMLIKPSNNL
jgi:hypothetical protein